MAKENSSKDRAPSSVFKVGAIALAFLIIGYQSALFVHRAASLRVASLRDHPDTVFVVDEALAARVLGASSGSASREMAPEDFALRAHPSRYATLAGPSRSRGHGRPRSPEPSPASASPAADDASAERTGGSGQKNGQNLSESVEKRSIGQKNGENLSGWGKNWSIGQENGKNLSAGRERNGEVVIVRKNAEHSAAVERERRRTLRVESFRFNPNTVSVEDLMRLGFSEKQAMAIDSYRQKGGRFRRPSDFAKSYVVADSVFERLRPFIDIPKLDINKADSAAFDALPGIGPYFAAKMVEYRRRLGGYSFKEQLMDIWHFDQEKYDGLSDLVICSRPPTPFRLWQLPEDSLRLHPYIRSWQAAHSIALYRSSMTREQWTVEAIAAAGILPPEDAAKLARCVIAEP